jgi:hypothetical protein
MQWDSRSLLPTALLKVCWRAECFYFRAWVYVGHNVVFLMHATTPFSYSVQITHEMRTIQTMLHKVVYFVYSGVFLTNGSCVRCQDP